MIKKVAILGSKDLAISIFMYLQESEKVEVVGFFDDFRSVGESVISDKKIIGKMTDVLTLYESKYFEYLHCGIGYNHLLFRREIWSNFSKKIPFLTYIHPTVFVGPNSKIGDGNFLGPGTVIDHNCYIGPNNFFYPSCTIAHHAIIKGHSFFSPRVSVAGFCNIEDCCFLGINSTLKDNLKIAENTRIGAGTLMLRDSKENSTYVGVPARVLNRSN
jgi:sugar O-acyltransferase (sialic acid O-acetyltransferase NeuD family)